ncbi:hypothetical protein L1049_011521 [Liquidambar formosana]|uniref:F-box associated beta-propeller type 1 domain-containing protein n=1 Tax=Liquidambar formosana TaxID=63359 RepID=A0AAP0X2Z4_LIQFO
MYTSCNGLLLLGGLFGGRQRLVVCNPITLFYMMLPPPPIPGDFSWALVHDDSVRKYKVVGMITRNLNMMQGGKSSHNGGYGRCFALTLGCSSSWRALVTYPELDSTWSRGVSANGKLHWLARFYENGQRSEEGWLYSMDIATEVFEKTPCPLPTKNSSFRFQEINGSLYSTVGLNEKIEIWVLKDWDTMAWTWLDTINLSYTPVAIADFPHPHGATKLIMRNGKELLSYDLQSQEMSHIAVKNKEFIPYCFECHVNSLVHWC